MAASGSPSLAVLLLFSSALFYAVGSRGETSAVFIDGTSNRYLRASSAAELNTITSSEIAATTSILLGFAPPVSDAVNSYKKLNEVLLPKPFEKPRAVFLLEIDGSEDALLSLGNSNSEVGDIFKYKVLDASQTFLQLPNEDEVLIVRSDEVAAVGHDLSSIHEELISIANWLGGSYISGKLSLPLPNGRFLELNVEKEAELQFALGLISLQGIVSRGLMVHEAISGSSSSPAELLSVHIKGFKALKEHGSKDLVNKAMELFQKALFKSVESLQRAHEGKIVAVVICKNTPYPGAMIDVNMPSHISRWLQEAAAAADNVTIPAVILVRQSLLWITGIILLISTLIGVCLLMNMPLTKDTLLYANVKLD